MFIGSCFAEDTLGLNTIIPKKCCEAVSVDKSARNSLLAQACEPTSPISLTRTDAESAITAKHFSSRHSFSKIDLEQCADGFLFGVGNAHI